MTNKHEVGCDARHASGLVCSRPKVNEDGSVHLEHEDKRHPMLTWRHKHNELKQWASTAVDDYKLIPWSQNQYGTNNANTTQNVAIGVHDELRTNCMTLIDEWERIAKNLDGDSKMAMDADDRTRNEVAALNLRRCAKELRKAAVKVLP